ncbi:calcium/calmodulin-dependent protein kinase [Leishmania donovani]|uniref:Calcium/calmodulin-dependent_protein_kinase_putat ive/GeneDB:LmjF.24.1730 n=1 Tax=Leishmania donovani TaxID=5661 RepID=A0A6J8FF23_LEIDO|nr:calcium/calmodulin-dependent protein kinase [Leishmania donovani]VDZ45125.1 calcium/calmodulin-dependent_protein_kinase_putative/GeneDB:LmjF.24.1730 [Leishmania donovani]
MGCSTSTHASPEADEDAPLKRSVYSASRTSDQVVSGRQNSNKDQTNDACTAVSENPSRTRSSSDTEGRAHGRGIGAIHYPNQLGKDECDGGEDEVVVIPPSADKSTRTRFTFPQRTLLNVGSHTQAGDSGGRKRNSITASPSSFTAMQRRLSDGSHGHSSFTTMSPAPPDAKETPLQLTQTRALPTAATIPTACLSISPPQRLSIPANSFAGSSASASGAVALPSQEQHQIETPHVNDGGFSIEWDEEDNTPRGRGIPDSTTMESGPCSVTRGMMAPSGSFGIGVGGGWRSKSPKWIDLSRKRSQSTVSLLSLADTPNNPHVLSSGSDFGRDILGGSHVFGGLATGGGSSRPQSGYAMGRDMCVERFDQQRHSNGLAVFCNQPRECALCRNATAAFACEVCDDFFLCENCRFDLEAVCAVHDPTHAILYMQDNHYNSSRTFGGDSIFSLSGDGGVSSLFYNPCFNCKRVIDDVEPVYRCDQCDYIVCQECFIQHEEPENAMERASSLSAAMAATREEQASCKPLPIESAALVLASGPMPPHEHELKRFQRKSRSNSVHEGAVVTKTRNSGGNKVINDYVVVRQIGHGSYAKVKLVQHVHTQELFALKILRRQKKAAMSGITLGRSRVKSAMAGISEDDLLREIAVMKFIDHPNVVKLKEVIEDVDSQKVYIIMEYCEKGPVHVLGDPALPLEQVRQYGADILRGLLHLHSEFLYHRDIKPANCLVNRDSVVKIADFGTCNSQIRTKLAEGTPAFSCPEQVRGEEVSGEVVDSWAFALTVYEMACGTLPVSTTSFVQHRSLLMSKSPVPIPKIGDEPLCDLLVQMLEKDLSKRLLLPAATRHPFFAECHVDVHGAVPGTAPRSIFAVLATSGGSAAAQPQQQQLPSLAELYDKALESVHRGKNLKDCFHGVRALRRVRRKEVETARHSGTGDQVGGGSAGAEKSSAYVMNSRDVYGGSDGSGSDGEDEEGAGRLWVGGRAGHKEEAAAAAAVEEAVEHHLFTQEPKLELAQVTLTAPATLEKLNRLHQVTAEMRLSHNALVRLAPLRLSTFSMLMDIAVTFNRLEAIPQEVLAAPRLVRLDLSHNRIDSIPGSLVTKALFLERLSLHHNLITSVGTTTITVVEPSPVKFRVPTSATATCMGSNMVAVPDASVVSSSITQTSLRGRGGSSRSKVVSVLAAPCLRHVRLSGNPLERLPDALETTHKLQLVLDAIPALMEQWDTHMQADSKPTTSTAAAATGGQSRLPAVIVWDDSFPVRIPSVEPAVWLAVNNVAIYRVQTLRLCQTRRVVLCQCADPRFPNGLFLSEELEVYFAALSKALQDCREQRQQLAVEAPFSLGAPAEAIPSEALPPIVGKAARNYVESYFFVTDDENEEEGGYHSLVSYLYDSLSANIPVLVVVVSSGTSCAVRTNIVAAISTCLTRLRGGDPEQLDAEQAELIVSTMRSLYA